MSYPVLGETTFMNRLLGCNKIALTAVCLTLATLLGAASISAQTSKGTIAGTLTDPAGGAISGATVTAQSTQLGENRSTVSGTYGEYRISAVLPGIYQVKVTADGFATVILDNVEVGASVEKSLDVRMEVSSSAQTITVESSGATLQTESAELSGSITKTEIQQLPINS